MRRVLTVLIAVTVLMLAVAGPAVAGPYEDYRRDGTIDGCKYSDEDLRRTREGLPPDVLQYTPGLADQLNAGREGCGGAAPGGGSDTRQFEAVPSVGSGGADGSGGGGGGAQGAGAGAAGGGADAKIPDPPAPEPSARTRLAKAATPPVSATTRGDVPGWAAALIVALAIGAVAAAIARFGGLSGERYTQPLRASFSEAGARSADVMAGLRDRLRVGR